MSVAEIRRETFYKLTNSADAPEVPSEGGRNLLRKTAVNTENLKLFGKTDTTVSVVEKDGHQVYKLVVSGSSNAGAYFNGNNAYYNLVKDRNYTFSFWVLTNKDKNYNINSLGHIQTVNTNSDKVGNDFMHQHTWPVYSTNVIKANTWTKVWCTFKATSNSYFKPYFWYLAAGDEIYIYDMMLNENSAPAPYSQAPEDLGWSTATLVPTQQQRYLWKFEYVYYSDGNVEITQPVNLTKQNAQRTSRDAIHNVRIAIRDSTDSHNVAFFDNVSGIRYQSANLQRFLAGSASILTIEYNSKDIDTIRTGCKLAFVYKERAYWLNIMDLQKKGYKVEITAYSLGLELNQEERGAHKPANAMSFAGYLAYYDPEHALELGVNEVADKRIKLEWTGTDTILARLFSIANSFDAELEFTVELNSCWTWLKSH